MVLHTEDLRIPQYVKILRICVGFHMQLGLCAVYHCDTVALVYYCTSNTMGHTCIVKSILSSTWLRLNTPLFEQNPWQSEGIPVHVEYGRPSE